MTNKTTHLLNIRLEDQEAGTHSVFTPLRDDGQFFDFGG